MKKDKELSFEDRLTRLTAIVASLENGEKSLEESVALYKEGVGHAAVCRELLENARHEVEVCCKEGIRPLAETGPFTGFAAERNEE